MSEEAAADGGKRLSVFGLLALGVVVAVVAILLVGTHNENEAPFTSLQVHPKLVGYQVLTPTDALGTNVTAALRRLGGARTNNIEVPKQRNRQYVVGRVDVDKLAADATYQIIVVDNRLHRVVPNTYAFPEPNQVATSGWSEAAGSLRKRFDWQPSGLDQGAAFVAGSATSLPFVARLPAESLPVTHPSSDLTVVLALTHGSDHVYWAVKLNVAPSTTSSPNGSTPQQSQ